MADCVFCKIVAGEIPASKEYEDEEFLAFRDIKPLAGVHVVFIPKQHLASLDAATDASALGKMLLVMRDTAFKLKINDAYKIVINNGTFQEVPHMHFHLLGDNNPPSSRPGGTSAGQRGGI